MDQFPDFIYYYLNFCTDPGLSRSGAPHWLVAVVLPYKFWIGNSQYDRKQHQVMFREYRVLYFKIYCYANIPHSRIFSSSNKEQTTKLVSTWCNNHIGLLSVADQEFGSHGLRVHISRLHMPGAHHWLFLHLLEVQDMRSRPVQLYQVAFRLRFNSKQSLT